MSSTVEGVGKCSKPEVEVGVQHVTCTEDAAAYVALGSGDGSEHGCWPAVFSEAPEGAKAAVDSEGGVRRFVG
ncbi:unnamed protein product [Prunus armeniaca]|uniref:Uncharacterized protein n=1 Tax=Prunus armeniaca TaxID=36596 RepID=A0A6J5Y568_PRUAR|nr:unnamed protein product [Prunus armeniaca]